MLSKALFDNLSSANQVFSISTVANPKYFVQILLEKLLISLYKIEMDDGGWTTDVGKTYN